MVLATATPKINGPVKSASAAKSNAWRGGMAREEMIVATTFALS